jgi:Family of unknown function (DUF5984)
MGEPPPKWALQLTGSGTMPLFEFKLAPLEAIEPWGDPPNLALHWFGLSDGSYYLDLGAARLLEYAARNGWPRFVEYQLARIHEDILSMLPDVLEPIPLPVRLRFRDGSLGDTLRHLRTASELLDGADPDLDAALDALGSRLLDTAYLSPGAGIWIWSHAMKIVIEWDNGDRLVDGSRAWTATRGRHELARDDFVEEVGDFDRRLMAAMEERVHQVRDTWNRPDVTLDYDRLEVEQHERRGWLDASLRRCPGTPDWQSVRRGLSRIRNRPA